MELIIVCAVAIVILWFYTSREQGKQVSKMERALKTVPGVWFKHKLIGADAQTAIAIDESRQLICLFHRRGEAVQRRLLPFSSIATSEVFEDGHTISSTSRASQLAGVAVGGVLLGGVGAIVGGLSGKSKSVEKVSRIELRLTVDDMSSPLHTVVLLNVESARDAFLYKASSGLAREWQSRMEIAMKRVEGA